MEKNNLINNEKMSKMFFWLDIWFQKSEDLPEFTDRQLEIYNQIKDNWNTNDRIKTFNSLKEKYNNEIKVVIEKVVKKNTLKDWEIIGIEKKDNSLQSFIDTLWGPLEEMGFIYTQKETGQKIQFHCTACPVYDLAKEMNATEWVYELICKGDYFMPVGFNSNIEFNRDKTLMQGDDYCNHTYTMKDMQE